MTIFHDRAGGMAPTKADIRSERSWSRLLPHAAPALSAFVVFAIVLSIGVMLWQSRARLAAETKSTLHSMAQALAEQTARTLQAVDLTIIGLTEALRYSEVDWHGNDPRIRELMQQKKSISPYLSSLLIVDSHGRLTHDVMAVPAPPLALDDHSFFNMHEVYGDLGLLVGEPIVGRTTQERMIPLSRRLETPDGRFDGVIVAGIDPAVLHQIYARMELGNRPEVALMREDGTLLARFPHDPAAMARSVSGSPLLDRFDMRGFLSGISPFDQTRRFYALERVPNSPLYVLIGLGEDSILARWRRTMTIYGVIAPIFLAIFSAVILSLYRYMHRRESLLHALHDSERRFRDFAEAASDRFWETDNQHRISWHSSLSSGHKLVGRTRWDSLGYDPEKHPEWRSHKADLDAHRPFREFHIARRGRDGDLRHGILSGKPFFGGNGLFLGYRGNFTDITARVHAQEQANLHRDRFIRAIENLSEGFALYDADDRLVICNSRFRELNEAVAHKLARGAPFAEFLEACLAADLVPEAHGREAEWLSERMAQHRNPPNVIEVLRAGRWYQVREQRDQDGGTLLFVLDIHEQKMVELHNQALNERIRMQFEYMPVACLVQSPSFTVIDWNPAAEKMFGYAREEMIGRSPYDTIILESDRPFVENIQKRLLSGETNITGISENITKDGRRILCEWIATPIFDNGKNCRGLLAMAMDITERRKAEEKLRQAQRMEAVGQLTGGIAHDFNNLLQVIFGNSEILMQNLEGNSALRRWAEMSKVAAERGANLTQRLLAFSRQQLLEPDLIHPDVLIADFVELLKPTLGESIEIASEIPAHPWPLTLDRGQLENALLNLALNARDAMPQGGRLLVKVENLAVGDGDDPDGLKSGDYVVLSVTDTGTGMEPAVAKRAFEPFFTTKDVDKGSGLGLSMVYGFVTQSGGRVKIDSEIGTGTTVTMIFPRAHPAESERRTPSPPQSALPTGNERILVVEDDEMVRSYVTSQLASLGYRVTEAPNGPAALAKLEECGPVDLLFTDLIMPGGMTGRQLADEVSRRFPATKILLTSGYSDNPPSADEPVAAGAHLLNKPYYRQDLASRVREILDTRARLES